MAPRNSRPVPEAGHIGWGVFWVALAIGAVISFFVADWPAFLPALGLGAGAYCIARFCGASD